MLQFYRWPVTFRKVANQNTKDVYCSRYEAALPNRRRNDAPAVPWGAGRGLFGAERSDERCRKSVLPTDGRSVRYEHGGKASVLSEDRPAS